MLISMSVLFYVVGYIVIASSNSVHALAGGIIIYAMYVHYLLIFIRLLMFVSQRIYWLAALDPDHHRRYNYPQVAWARVWPYFNAIHHQRVRWLQYIFERSRGRRVAMGMYVAATYYHFILSYLFFRWNVRYFGSRFSRPIDHHSSLGRAQGEEDEHCHYEDRRPPALVLRADYLSRGAT